LPADVTAILHLDSGEVNTATLTSSLEPLGPLRGRQGFPELASYLRIEERELEAGGLS